MEKDKIEALVKEQRKFFDSEATFPVYNRIAALKRLHSWIKLNEAAIAEALKADLNKSEFESYMTETGMVLGEISFLIKHLPLWAQDKVVPTPLAQFLSLSYEKPEPYGVVLIMSPWNYPFQLAIEPLAGALAAGNTAVIKPSAYSPHTSSLIRVMIEECFDPGWVTVIEGGRAENTALLEEKFDYIFFTGSVAVGKLVMEKASKHLTPVSLELGGKSPVIIDESANIKLAARRLAFGKYLNAGQTCVAPDYLYVHEKVKEPLIREMKLAIKKFYGDDPLHNPNFPRMVNEKHFNRVLGLLEDANVLVGGESDSERLVIAPTIADGITDESKLMGEEIFGPVLPVMTFNDLEAVIKKINSRPKPLALYLFTSKKAVVDRVMKKVSFGGGCVNDTIIHLATSYMGFGGVGESGMGSYHGKKSFDTFTHYKSIVDKSTLIDLPMRYAPYNKINFKLLKMFLK